MARNQPPRIFDALPPHRGLNFPKPKPNFDWAELDQQFAPVVPPEGITIKDLCDHFQIKASRAQQIAREAVDKGLLVRIAKGWYTKP